MLIRNVKAFSRYYPWGGDDEERLARGKCVLLAIPSIALRCKILVLMTCNSLQRPIIRKRASLRSGRKDWRVTASVYPSLIRRRASLSLQANLVTSLSVKSDQPERTNLKA